MSDASRYLYIFPFLALIIGGVLPSILLGEYLPQTEWSDRTQSLMFLSMFVIVAWVFNKVGRKSGKLKVWATDTITGVTLLLFSFMFLLSLSVNVFLLIPLPSFVLFILSIFCSVLGCYLFFNMSDDSG